MKRPHTHKGSSFCVGWMRGTLVCDNSLPSPFGTETCNSAITIHTSLISLWNFTQGGERNPLTLVLHSTSRLCFTQSENLTVSHTSFCSTWNVQWTSPTRENMYCEACQHHHQHNPVASSHENTSKQSCLSYQEKSRAQDTNLPRNFKTQNT